MGIVFALLFLAVAVVAVVAYGGTPHGGPTIVCGPMHIFGYTTTIQADCRYVSVGELVVAGVFLFIAIIAALSGRPSMKG